MGFERLESSTASKQYRRLYNSLKRPTSQSMEHFLGFDVFNKRLFDGDFLVLKRRCRRQVYGWSTGDTFNILATHYQAIDPELTHNSSIGAILLSPTVSEKESSLFFDRLRQELAEPAVSPLNGHINLGFALPQENSPTSFLTAPPNEKLRQLLAQYPVHRNYFALSVRPDSQLKTKLSSELSSTPEGLSTRKVSKKHFKRDIRIYNQLVNTCLQKHPGFFPLTFEEEWDLMKNMWHCIEPDYFQFLIYRKQEVGFCFGVPDYNEFMQPFQDIKNTLRILTHKKKTKRARIIYSGILPEFQGKKWFKHVRHRVLLNMIKNGVNEVESSYIDQDNFRSLGNVQSTGARKTGTFRLFELPVKE